MKYFPLFASAWLLAALLSTSPVTAQEAGNIRLVAAAETEQAPRPGQVQVLELDSAVAGASIDKSPAGSEAPPAANETFRILLRLDEGWQLFRARRLGLEVSSPGASQHEVPASLLPELRSAGLRYHVIGGTTRLQLPASLATGAFTGASPRADEAPSAKGTKGTDTGTIQLGSGTINLPIDDNTGTAQAYRLRNLIAPSGATVTDLRYRLRISDEGDGAFYCGDYEIWLFSGDVEWEHRVYDNLGGRTDGGFDDDSADDLDIYLNWRNTSFFDGETPNDWWGVLVWDNLSGDDGELDYIEFEVDWQVDVGGDAYEPDDSAGQAWPHPHNFISAFRSIDPADDEDWIRFSLSQRSDVTIETLGTSGDTRMWLYDAGLGLVEFDDDGGSGAFSLIERTGVNALDAGTYYVKIDEFGNNDVIADYAISLGVTAAALPDLTAPSFGFTSWTPTEGDAFYVAADISNDGAGSAGSSHARFYLSIDNDFDVSDDLEILPEKSVPALGPGATAEARWDFTFPDLLDLGTYSVWMVVVVDSRGEVVESDESNTFKSNNPLTVTNAGLDLAITQVMLRDQPAQGGSEVTDPVPGSQLYPHVYYSYDGQADLTGTVWRLELDGVSICSFTGTISPGGWAGWCVSPTTVPSGNFTLTGRLDPNGSFSETNEANNVTSRNYSACSPDAYEPDDSAGQASTLFAASTQSHSICPIGDGDWARFTLGETSAAVIETSGVAGDTRLWLYDASVTQIDYDDDGNGLFSRIERTCDGAPLAAGTYYVQVDEFGDNELIEAYGLSLDVTACAGAEPEIRVEPLTLHFSDAGGGMPGTRSGEVLEQRIVRLRGRDIDPLLDSTPLGELSQLSSGRHVLMQFERLPSPAERRAMADRGLELLSYLPDSTYWVALGAGIDLAAAAVPAGGARWAWLPEPALKMHPLLASGTPPAQSLLGDGSVELQALFFADVDRAEAARVIAGLAGVRLRDWKSPRLATLEAPQERLEELAALDAVEWLEPAPLPDVAFNVTAAERIRVDDLQAAPLNLDGAGVVVGVWDGGAVDAHNDFGNRLTTLDAGVSEHATHVAGTVAGDGSGNNNALGMAPGAAIRSYDWTGDGAEMRADGQVDISNHSYGTVTGWWWDGNQWVDTGDGWFGQYSATTADWDDIVDDTGLLVFKSAGNDRNDCGAGGDCDGPFDSIPHKGVAKNILTICATDDTDGMSTFSSWGPADDGRVKPDLCANGVTLTSTEPNQTYGVKSGTSMASPSAAGSAALLHEHFTDQVGAEPEAATLKALLIHGARDLGRVGPDYEHGWGLIDAQASADLISAGQWRTGSIDTTGESATFQVNVAAAGNPLEVTLVWTDPAGSPAAATALVNDLDLSLQSPSGTTHFPWTLNAANPAAAANRGVNRRDNVEQVVVDSAEAGDWTVTINGFAVPMGPQDFTLVAEGLGGGGHFTIFNDGGDDLHVSSILPQVAAPWLGITPTGAVIPAGGSRQVSVAVDFASAPFGSTTTRLLVSSDDADESPYPGGVYVTVERAASQEGLIFSDGFESGDSSAWAP